MNQLLIDLSQLVGITRFDPDYYPLQLDNHVLLLRSCL